MYTVLHCLTLSVPKLLLFYWSLVLAPKLCLALIYRNLYFNTHVIALQLIHQLAITMSIVTIILWRYHIPVNRTANVKHHNKFFYVVIFAAYVHFTCFYFFLIFESSYFKRHWFFAPASQKKENTINLQLFILNSLKLKI